MSYESRNSKSLIDSSKLMECLNCNQPFSSQEGNNSYPRLLSCAHTFCTKCLAGMGKKKKINCPTCDRVTNENDLLPNLALADLIKMLEEDRYNTGKEQCGECKRKEATVYCRLCSHCPSTCAECFDQMHSFTSLRHHEQIPISEKINEIGVCKVHEEKLKLFCMTDQMSICFLCERENHKGHETVVAKNAAAKVRSEIETNLQQTQSIVGQLTDMSIQIERDIAGLVNNYESTLKNVEKEKKKLFEAIEGRFKNLCDKAATIFSASHDILKRFQNSITHSLSHATVIAGESKRVLNLGDAIILQSKHYIDSVSMKLQASHHKVKMEVDNHRMQFSLEIPAAFDNSFYKLLENFGDVGGPPAPKIIECKYRSTRAMTLSWGTAQSPVSSALGQTSQLSQTSQLQPNSLSQPTHHLSLSLSSIPPVLPSMTTPSITSPRSSPSQKASLTPQPSQKSLLNQSMQSSPSQSLNNSGNGGSSGGGEKNNTQQLQLTLPSPVLEYSLEYQLVGQQTDEKKNDISNNSNPFKEVYRGTQSMCMIENLTPQTAYNVRVRAKNNAGWSEWSPTFQFATLKNTLEWDPTLKHNAIILTNNNCEASGTAKNQSIGANIRFDSGVHEWEFELVGPNNSHAMFGVVPAGLQNFGKAGHIADNVCRGWALFSNGPGRFYQAAGNCSNVSNIGPGPVVIGVKLDLVNHIIEYYRGGIGGSLIGNQTNVVGPVRPACTLYVGSVRIRF